MTPVFAARAEYVTAALPVASALAEPGAAGAAPAAPALRRGASLSCVVPCRNEAANLQSLLPMLRDALNEVASSWEIILVDDGSTDATAAVIARWTLLNGFRGLQLSRNFGKEAALTAGLQAAVGDMVVTMDADLQHPASLINTFVEHWRRGAEVVYAVRENRRDEGVLKRLGARAFYRLLNAGDRFEVPAGAGDFRLMDRSVVDTLLALPERNRFMKGLYAWVGFDAVAVPYTPAPRRHGHSHYSLPRLIALSLDGLTAFTKLPLRAVSLVGFTLALLAFAYGAFVSVSYLLYGNHANGWTTIVASLMGFAGIQLVSLGIVGEYVGRIFEEVKARPLFVVKRESGRGLQRTRA